MYISIIDEDIGDTELLKSALREAGLIGAVATTSSFDIAQLLLERHFQPGSRVRVYPDAFVVEAVFNAGEARKLVRLIRSCKPMSAIPVIIFSHSDNVMAADGCRSEGADSFVGKNTAGPAGVCAYLRDHLRKHEPRA